MREYNYFCTNDKCSQKFVNIFIPLEDEEKSKFQACSVCGCYMKCVGHKVWGGVLTFESRTPAEKREIMHKRSVAHFKKTDKGDLANYKNTITNNIRKKVEGRG